jgi:hypothetical protein
MNSPIDIILMNMPPQVRQQIENTYQMAVRSGNPEQFLRQRFGNNEGFNKAFNIKQGKSPEEFNNYLGNISRSMNGQTR